MPGNKISLLGLILVSISAITAAMVTSKNRVQRGLIPGNGKQVISTAGGGPTVIFTATGGNRSYTQTYVCSGTSANDDGTLTSMCGWSTYSGTTLLIQERLDEEHYD